MRKVFLPTSFSLFLRLLIILTCIIGCSSLFRSESNSNKEFETELGIMKLTKLDIIEESLLDIKDGKWIIKKGAIRIKPNNVLVLDEPLKYTVNFTLNTNPQFTVIQNKADGTWLATDGILPLENSHYVVLEGTVIKVIGGKNTPFLLLGEELSNTAVVIKNGQVVPIK